MCQRNSYRFIEVISSCPTLKEITYSERTKVEKHCKGIIGWADIKLHCQMILPPCFLSHTRVCIVYRWVIKRFRGMVEVGNLAKYLNSSRRHLSNILIYPFHSLGSIKKGKGLNQFRKTNSYPFYVIHVCTLNTHHASSSITFKLHPNSLKCTAILLTSYLYLSVHQ